MVNGKDPDKIINKADSQRKEITKTAPDALQLFLDKDGLLLWEDAISEISDQVKLSNDLSKEVLASLTGDIVDPVQTITSNNDRYVGIIALHEYQDSGAYGYIHYSDKFGKRKRVVCAQCVKELNLDSEVTHATEGEGSADNKESWQSLLNKITSHYADEHSESPSHIDIGASLVSSTTMGGNQAWHQGNVTGGSNINIGTQDISVIQGPGSGLDADSVDGKDAADLGGVTSMTTTLFAVAQNNATDRIKQDYAGLTLRKSWSTVTPSSVVLFATIEAESGGYGEIDGIVGTQFGSKTWANINVNYGDTFTTATTLDGGITSLFVNVNPETAFGNGFIAAKADIEVRQYNLS